MLAGSVPLSWLLVTEKIWRDDTLYREEGIIPDNLLDETVKISKPFNWPMASEIFPTKLLKDTRKCVSSEETFPREDGIPPTKLFLPS